MQTFGQEPVCVQHTFCILSVELGFPAYGFTELLSNFIYQVLTMCPYGVWSSVKTDSV